MNLRKNYPVTVTTDCFFPFCTILLIIIQANVNFLLLILSLSQPFFFNKNVIIYYSCTLNLLLIIVRLLL